jgi:hypothetical protein
MRLMSWLWLIFALLVVGPLVGFVGLAVVSAPAGQYFIVAVICAIATYWTALANSHQRTQMPL